MACINGACVPKYEKVEWVYPSPREGEFASDASVQMRAQLQYPAGFVPSAAYYLPLPITLWRDGGAEVNTTINFTDAGYLAHFMLGEGAWKATVWAPNDAGQSATVSFTVDWTAPVLTVTAPSPPYANDGGALSYDDPNYMGAWKRDDRVVLKVSSSEDLVSPTVLIEGLVRPDGGMGQTASAPTVSCASRGITGCELPKCTCVEADLSLPTMNAFSGEFKINAEASDLASNHARADAGFLRVTRFRWVRTIGKTMKATPAIGSNGTVYVAGTDGIAGYVWAVDPNGALKWQSANLGAVEASPAVATVPDGGPEVVFYASKSGTNAWLGALRADSGVDYDSNLVRCAIGGASDAPPSPAVVVSGLSVGAVTVLSNTLCSYIANASAMTRVQSQVASASAAGSTNLTNVVAMGHRVAFADITGSVVAHSIPNLGNWSSMSDWSVSLAGGGTVRGLAVHGPLGGRKIVGGGGPGVGQLFQLSDALNGAIDWRFPAAGATSTWAPSVLDEGNIFYGTDTPARELHRRGQSDAGFIHQSLVSATNSTPLLGSDGVIYVATIAGELIALDSSSLAVLWNSGPMLTDLRASPTLDCNRKESGRPGYLYLASTNGTLAAVSVDAERLRTTAAWPKYQHDSANSGNAGCP
jgi:hypothetical protein